MHVLLVVTKISCRFSCAHLSGLRHTEHGWILIAVLEDSGPNPSFHFFRTFLVREPLQTSGT